MYLLLIILRYIQAQPVPWIRSTGSLETHPGFAGNRPRPHVVGTCLVKHWHPKKPLG